MNKNSFLVNFIISVKVNEVEKINLEQDLDRQLYINEINVKDVNFLRLSADDNFFPEGKKYMAVCLHLPK